MIMNSTTRSLVFYLTVAAASFVLSPAVAYSQEMLARSSDKEVKSLVKALTTAERKFEKALDSKFKRSILRGPGVEVKVGDYLEDLSDATTNLEKRFTGSYAASAEATEVLQRSSLMHGYVRKNPSLKGANEWDSVAVLLQQLATAYGSTFPLPDDAAIRRIGDAELADAASELRKFSRSFQKTLRSSTRKIPDLSEPVKAGVDDLKFIESSSRTLASRIQSGKPASAEARQLMEAVTRVQALMDMEAMPEQATAEWAAAARPITKITQSFGLEPSG